MGSDHSSEQEDTNTSRVSKYQPKVIGKYNGQDVYLGVRKGHYYIDRTKGKKKWLIGEKKFQITLLNNINVI